MEALAQRLQTALGPIPVYLGSEHLDTQVRPPFVVMVPGGGSYGPPTGAVRYALADVQARTIIYCKAVLFEEALLLAEACYAALAPGQPATIDLGTELWGNDVLRVAELTITQAATLTRADVALVQVKTFTQRVHLTPPSTPEVPDDQEVPEGVTQFE